MNTKDIQNNMISLAEHASELAKLLGFIEDPDAWVPIQEWLKVASGIRSVRFETVQFDDSHGWCESADEFYNARDELLQRYVTELTRFTYCWAALECAVEVIDPPDAPQRGKINKACYYIQQHSSNDRGVPWYCDVLSDLREIVYNLEEPKISNRFKRPPSFVLIRSLAMYVIYSLRNQFAHGALHLPFPDEDHRPQSPYVGLIQLASRLTLMSIQHLLAAAHRADFLTWEAIHDDGEVEHEFDTFLASLHVKRRPIEGQLRLI